MELPRAEITPQRSQPTGRQSACEQACEANVRNPQGGRVHARRTLGSGPRVGGNAMTVLYTASPRFREPYLTPLFANARTQFKRQATCSS